MDRRGGGRLGGGTRNKCSPQCGANARLVFYALLTEIGGEQEIEGASPSEGDVCGFNVTFH